MYQSSANNSVLAGDGEGGGDGGLTANNPISQIMDPTKQQQNINYNGMQQQPQQHQQQELAQAQAQAQQPKNNSRNIRKKAYVKITEQPAGKALRFRYECEGRSAGSIPGVNSTPENKTYPTIEVVGYKGRAVVVVSCVTKDQPYRPHPHNLVGKEGCKKGVCTLEINPETMKAVFSNLGIQCVKKKDIEAALKAREEIRVDPFKTGFAHRFQLSSMDLNSVRLCFQVFTESDQKGRFTQPLQPVVSEPIYDKKAMSDLVICRLCSCSASVLGNTQIILLCEKVAKDDISVRFYEESNGQTIWEAFGDFQQTDVHKQTAIAFKTPRYHKIDITEPAKVFVQLKRPSDGVTSEAIPFDYVPLDSDPGHLKRKRQKTNDDSLSLLLQIQQNQPQNDHPDDRQVNINRWNIANVAAIKTEPGDTSPQRYGIYRAPPELTPSPQPRSPSSVYTHNTPSPYNITATAVPAAQCNQQQLMLPNQQYNAINTGAGNSANPNAIPPPMAIRDYNAFGQQTQQQQQQHQQYHNNNNYGGACATHWETKYDPATAAGNNNNLSNLNNANTFTMHNVLTPANSVGAPGNGTATTCWNITNNQFHHPPHHTHHPQQHQHLQQQQQQEQQQQYQQLHQTTSNGVAANNIATVNALNTNNNNNSEHGLSNLLTFDSEQLVRINSEDQQMLRLNSEDLQISNLSIST